MDEAEGEIWQSKKLFFWLAAPFDSCPIPSLKIYAVFRGKLSSNSSSNLEITAVSEKEKPITKDERRKNLEVICHSGLNNFCNMIVLLSKSQTRHPARAQAPLHLPHMPFWHNKTLQTPPPVRSFFCAYEVAQSLHENTMLWANTRRVLARFGDNNWEKREDFVKPFYVKKLVWGMEESLSARARWMTCKTYDHVAKSESRQNFAKVAKILRLSQKYSKTNPAKM